MFEGTSTSLIRSGAPSNFWGEAEAHKIFTINVLPAFEDPDEPGVFLSRKNLLEGNKRKFNLDHLMAFGTAATCYVPVPNRDGGKTPGQRKYFRGAIVGYAENTPAYRVWDIADRVIRIVSYNFTIAHEGFYPLKDPTAWPKDFLELPRSFSPTEDEVLDDTQWNLYEFDDEDATEFLSRGVTKPPIRAPSLPPTSVIVPIPATSITSAPTPIAVAPAPIVEVPDIPSVVSAPVEVVPVPFPVPDEPEARYSLRPRHDTVYNPPPQKYR